MEPVLEDNVSTFMQKRKLMLRNELYSFLTKKKRPVPQKENAAVSSDEPDELNSQRLGRSEQRRSGRRVEHGYHLVRGKMDHGMEDYVVAENREIDEHELGLYAIFDGHSGREVANYLQSNLFDNILREVRYTVDRLDWFLDAYVNADMFRKQFDFWTNPKRAIRRAYQETDEDILEEIASSRGGSTAVTAILVDKEMLIVANVGDSHAVLCKDERAKQLSVDHEPEKEREAIESKGGCVIHRLGNVPRVDGQLAMSRAFGDGRLKEHITSEPDLVVKKIDDATEFIVLASDGLWKVMSNEEAYDSIRGMEDAKKAAEKLIKEALARGSKDDISCIIVAFG